MKIFLVQLRFLIQFFVILLLCNQFQNISSFIFSSQRIRTEISRGSVGRIYNHREYLIVNFGEKEEVKALGAKYDGEKRKWFIPIGSNPSAFLRWMRVYLNVPYADKEQAKMIGAKWDSDLRKWYVRGDVVLEKNVPEKWIPAAPFNSRVIDTKNTPVAIIDIDTTGLPLRVQGNFDEFSSLSSYNPSRILQLSYILTDFKTWAPIEKNGIIIKTDGFPIEAVEFHGITLERSQSEGVPFIIAAKQMMNAIGHAKFLYFHNAEFCVNIIKSEFYRYGLFEELERFSSIKPICIMERSRKGLGLMHIANKPKVPSMKELLRVVLKEELPAIHTSDMDVEYIRRIIKAWVENEQSSADNLLYLQKG